MTVLLVASGIALGAAPAAADPSPDDWYRLRMCESSNRYTINTGNGYYGAYQFDKSTWESMGGSGFPHEASPAEQDYRALKLYRMRGWAPWPACRKKLNLVDDADARSGVIPPMPAGLGDPTPRPDPTPTTTSVPPAAPTTSQSPTTSTTKKTEPPRSTSPSTTTKATPKHTAPVTTAAPASRPITTSSTPVAKSKKKAAAKKKVATPTTSAAPAAEDSTADNSTAVRWPGREYFPGEYSEDLRIWQEQAATLGYDIVPTGYFGPKTERAARDLQQRGGLTLVGYIGPQTWSAVWTDTGP